MGVSRANETFGPLRLGDPPAMKASLSAPSRILESPKGRRLSTRKSRDASSLAIAGVPLL